VRTSPASQKRGGGGETKAQNRFWGPDPNYRYKGSPSHQKIGKNQTSVFWGRRKGKSKKVARAGACHTRQTQTGETKRATEERGKTPAHLGFWGKKASLTKSTHLERTIKKRTKGGGGGRRWEGKRDPRVDRKAEPEYFMNGTWTERGSNFAKSRNPGGTGVQCVLFSQ